MTSSGTVATGTREVRLAPGRPSRNRGLAQAVARVARTAPYWHVLVAASAIIVAISRLHADEWVSLDSATVAMRLAALGLAASVAFTLDDPTEPTLAGTPIGVWARRSTKVLAMLALVAAVWFALLSYAEAIPSINATPPAWGPDGFEPGTSVTKPPSGWWLPIGGLSIELAAFAAVVLAGAAWGSRLSADRAGGLVGVGAGLVTLLVASMLPLRWGLLVTASSGPERWHDAHVRWAWLAVVATLVAVWGNRDPGRTTLATRIRSRQGGPT